MNNTYARKFNSHEIAMRAISKGATSHNGNNFNYIPEIISKIHRLAVTYARIQEIWCSVELNDTMQAYYEKREKQLQIKMLEHANKIGCKIEYQGDPRGMTVRLICPQYRDENDYIGIA
jgi:hypothetical protein